MKAKECLRRSLRLAEIGIRKATSYKVVKGRLSRGLYSDEFLQERIRFEKESLERELHR